MWMEVVERGGEIGFIYGKYISRNLKKGKMRILMYMDRRLGITIFLRLFKDILAFLLDFYSFF